METKRIVNIVKGLIKEHFNNDGIRFKITEVKNFSPTGINVVPNGHPLEKGGYFKECKDNKEKFKINNFEYLIKENFEIEEAIHHNQYGLTEYKGGVITFSTDINSLNVSKNKLLNWVQQKGKTFLNRIFSKNKLNKLITNFNSTTDKELGGEHVEDYIGAFSIGNFFSGRYLDDSGKVYDEKSLSIEVNGISTKGLIYLAEEIVREFQQETVLVKDLNTNKIFLVNQLKGNDYDLKNINQKS